MYRGEPVSSIWIWKDRVDSCCTPPLKWSPVVHIFQYFLFFLALPFSACTSVWLFFFLSLFLLQALSFHSAPCPARTFTFCFEFQPLLVLTVPISQQFSLSSAFWILAENESSLFFLALASRKWCDHKRGKRAPPLMGKAEWQRCAYLLPTPLACSNIIALQEQSLEYMTYDFSGEREPKQKEYLETFQNKFWISGFRKSSLTPSLKFRDLTL